MSTPSSDDLDFDNDLDTVDYFHSDSQHPSDSEITTHSTFHLLHPHFDNESETLHFVSSSSSSAASGCVTLAFVSILLNSYVILTLCYHKQKIFKNLFYLLVFHCSIVDLLRAISLIVWFLPEMDWIEVENPDVFSTFMRVKQFLVIELRSLNMLTVFNLLVFTFNEFIVVKRPLHYRRIIRRRAVVIALVLSWLACVFFGLCSVLLRNYSPESPRIQRNSSLDDVDYLMNRSHISRRSARGDESLQYAFIFAVVVICGGCILVVFTCYAQIMLRVRQFHRFDSLKSLAPVVHDGLRFRGSVSTCSVDNRRRRLQVLVRHKYLLVIGLVLLVDVLFLVPYSLIQIMQYYHISDTSASVWTESRWISQLLIALHSVLQPLCYFRMGEFRKLAFCKKGNVSHGGEWCVRAMNKSEDQLAVLTEDDEEILAMDIDSHHEMQSLNIRDT